MTVAEEQIILHEYKKAFKHYYRQKVVDLDLQLHHTNCFLILLEDILSKTTPDVPPYRKSGFVIIYVVKGGGEKRIGKYTIPVKERTLMLVPSRVTTSSRYSANTKGYYLSFNLSFFLKEEFPRHYLLKLNLFNAGLTPYIYLSIRAGKMITDIFEVIHDETKQQRKNKEDLLALKILEIILLSDRMFSVKDTSVKTHHPPLLVRYIDLIQEHYKDQHSTGFYAKQLHTHPNVLNALAKRHLGQSAKAVLDTKLTTKSRYLLEETNLSVKEIAYELGFSSPSQFFRFFKRNTKYSPAHYRIKPFDFAVQ